MSHLGQFPIFRGLSEEELAVFMDAGTVRDLADGEVLFEQGDASEHVYIVRHGHIRIYATNEGVEETYTTLMLGAVLGEIGVIKQSPRSASAAASGPASVLIFEGDVFVELAETFPAIAKMVQQTMFGRFRNDANRSERRKARGQGGHLFPVFSSTGGAGTSLIAANIAGFVKELSKKRVLVFDLDLMFGDQDTIFGVEKGPTLTDIAMQPEIQTEDVMQLVQTTSSGVDVMRAPVHPEEAEFVSAELVNTCIDLLLPHYDFVFCDTSCNLDNLALDLFERAAAPIYVLTPDIASVRNALRWLDLVERIGLDVSRTKMILNQVDTSDKTSADFVKERFGKRVVDQIPLDQATAKMSVNRGQLLGEVDPKARLTQAIRSLSADLLGIEIAAVTSPSGFFSRWM